MKKQELIEISRKLFYNINHYVIEHDFELEVYYITNDNFISFNGDRLDIMDNFISYIFGKVITQTIIKSLDKTIKVFVRDKKELEND